MDNSSPWMTIQEAVSYARVSQRTLQDWLKSGLKHARIGRKIVLINTHWIDQDIESFTSDSTRVDAIVR